MTHGVSSGCHSHSAVHHTSTSHHASSHASPSHSYSHHTPSHSYSHHTPTHHSTHHSNHHHTSHRNPIVYRSTFHVTPSVFQATRCRPYSNRSNLTSAAIISANPNRTFTRRVHTKQLRKALHNTKKSETRTRISRETSHKRKLKLYATLLKCKLHL
jgi:hypothetical protein